MFSPVRLAIKTANLRAVRGTAVLSLFHPCVKKSNIVYRSGLLMLPYKSMGTSTAKRR